MSPATCRSYRWVKEWFVPSPPISLSVADFLWASSSASSSTAATIWSSRLDLSTRPTTLLLPVAKNVTPPISVPMFRDIGLLPLLLPSVLCPCSVGECSSEPVHSHVDIYNFSDNTWEEGFDMPKEMVNSHLGIVTDGNSTFTFLEATDGGASG